MPEQQTESSQPLPLPLAKARPAQATVLRALERSDRLFWRPTTLEQLHLSSPATIADKGSDGNNRFLSANELAAMALNEIASQQGRGFFYHLKCRDRWKKFPGEEQWPSSRQPPHAPSAQFPDLLFVNYVWSRTSRDRFLASTPRARFMACDGLLNLPKDETPVYALQYAARSSYPIYATGRESLIVLAGSSKYFLARSSEWKMLLGINPRATGPDRGSKIHTKLLSIWDEGSEQSSYVSKGKISLARSQCYELGSLEAVYEKIVMTCAPAALPSTWKAYEVCQMIPRPLTPEPGTALGPMPGEQGRLANPPSRREHRRRRGRVPVTLQPSAEKAEKSDIQSD